MTWPFQRDRLFCTLRSQTCYSPWRHHPLPAQVIQIISQDHTLLLTSPVGLTGFQYFLLAPWFGDLPRLHSWDPICFWIPSCLHLTSLQLQRTPTFHQPHTVGNSILGQLLGPDCPGEEDTDTCLIKVLSIRVEDAVGRRFVGSVLTGSLKLTSRARKRSISVHFSPLIHHIISYSPIFSLTSIFKFGPWLYFWLWPWQFSTDSSFTLGVLTLAVIWIPRPWPLVLHQCYL